MNSCPSTLEKIAGRAAELSLGDVRKILILYEEKILYIGDCCVRFNRFKYFKSWLNNASIQINFTLQENRKFYEGLLKYNPHVDRITDLGWDAIDLDEYDIVFCVSLDEPKILGFLDSKYGEAIAAGRFRPVVLSISDLTLQYGPRPGYIFPTLDEMARYILEPRPGELYLSKAEKTWANEWLEEKGIKEDDRLFIILDSSSSRKKIMNITVYFEVLSYLLSKSKIKILIFDENTVGKEEFYSQWLDKQSMKKMIFSKGLSLRDNICLIGSKYTRLIFGPCTGLMHCASSVYNYYLNSGTDIRDIPLMITYTGVYVHEHENASFWWGTSPLMNCLLLRKYNGSIVMMQLHELTEFEKGLKDTYPCSEYTARMFIDLIERKLASPITVIDQTVNSQQSLI